MTYFIQSFGRIQLLDVLGSRCFVIYINCMILVEYAPVRTPSILLKERICIYV